MLITDYYDYIIGTTFMPEIKKAKNEYRIRKEEDRQEMLKIFDMSLTAKINLEALDDSAKFYENERDIENLIAPEKREEYFYTMKNNDIITPVISAKALFYMKKCYKEFGSMNYFVKVCPKTLLKRIFSKGYIEDGFTFLDVVRSFVDINYEPVKDVSRVVKNGANYDIYIPSIDNIAVVPKLIGEAITEDDVDDIELKDNVLYLAGRELKSLRGYRGITSGILNISDVI